MASVGSASSTALQNSEAVELRELSHTAASTSSPMQAEHYDYTEGASTIDIDDVITESRRARRLRRDSQIGRSYDGDSGGAVFDGPGSAAVPSSVSRMSHREMSRERARSLRRMSSDYSSQGGYSRHRRRSEDGDAQVTQAQDSSSLNSGETTSEELEDGGTPQMRRRRRRSNSSENVQTSMFDSLAQLFRGPQDQGPSGHRLSFSGRSATSSRRPGRLRRGSRAPSVASEHAIASDEDEERWGYTSAEEDSSSEDELLKHGRSKADQASASDVDYGSLPPSPSGSLPNMALDPVFGDTRIDMELELEPMEPPPPGPPSRQYIFMQDEDITVRFLGFETIAWRQWVWRACCILSFGLLGLLGHWFPRIWLRWVARERSFKDSENGFVVVEVLPNLLIELFLFLCSLLNPRPRSGTYPCIQSRR